MSGLRQAAMIAESSQFECTQDRDRMTGVIRVLPHPPATAVSIIEAASRTYPRLCTRS